MVAGVSGTGKTTLAKKLEARLGVPRYELDALYHGPGWVKRPEFEADVEAFTAGPRWVTEDQYSAVLGHLIWQRADTLIWLDLPRGTVMWRVVRRSFIYAGTRRELWNGNRERFRDWLDPGHPIRWAWAQHASKRERVAGRVAAHPELEVVRLMSARAVREWLAALRWESVVADGTAAQNPDAQS